MAITRFEVAMPEETGWTDPFRVRFPITIRPILERISRGKNRSIPNFIIRSTLKRIILDEVEKNIDSFIDDLMRNGENSQLLKCGNK